MLPSVAELKRVVFDQETIAERVRELGQEITAAYPDGELLVLGLLKGSFIFLSDLVRNIDRPIQIDFLVASSYGDGTVSSGNVRLVYDPETKLEGKHILLVEDIIDTGKTLNKLVALLKQRRPERVWSFARCWTNMWLNTWSWMRNSWDSTLRRCFSSAMGSITRKTSGTFLISRV